MEFHLLVKNFTIILICGRRNSVNSDNKPFATIFIKSINEISTRLQKIQFKLIKQDIAKKFQNV